MTTTFRLVRAELRKSFVSFAFLGTAGIAVGLTVLSVLADAAVAGKQGQPALGTTGDIDTLLKFGAVTTVAMLVFGILASGGEFRHRTIVSTMLVAPRRGKVVVTKAIAVALAAVVITSMTFGIGVATIYGVLAAHHSHHLHHLAADGLRLFLGSVVGAVAFGVFGTALGFVARSTAGAVVIFGGWVIFGELAILKTVAPHLEKWLPVGMAISLTNIVKTGASALTPLTAAVVLGIYGALLLAGAAAVTIRRDVA